MRQYLFIVLYLLSIASMSAQSISHLDGVFIKTDNVEGFGFSLVERAIIYF